MKKIITTIILMTMMLFSYSQQEPVKYSDEIVYTQKILKTKLTRRVIDGDTTYLYQTRNQNYPIQNYVILFKENYCKESLNKIVKTALEVYKTKESVIMNGRTYEAGPFKTVVIRGDGFLIQLYVKNLKKILKETS
ncbi:MAG: Unknown protein [uncultured Sulfurovum sp.]|uniref:Uncharacterized protein n=1 Tax=uncultured Sulfurovum sp. TaxID=269237 RepID=A0A6S6T515_9BACT|nr:MAG: Unknown protein [uncultured Sulfurovum sp.]